VAPILRQATLASTWVYEHLSRAYGWMMERRISELHLHFTRFATFLRSSWTGLNHLVLQVREDFSKDSAHNVIQSYVWRTGQYCAGVLSASSEYLRRRCLDLMELARSGGSELLSLITSLDYQDLYPFSRSFLLGSLGLLCIGTSSHPNWGDLSTEPVITAFASQGVLLSISYNRFPTIDRSATGVKLTTYCSMLALLTWAHGRLFKASKRAKMPFGSVLRMMAGVMFITVGAAMITS